MTNIDEIVKALRYCASGDAVCPCKWAEDNPAAEHCEDRLFLQAADAIEALQKHCNQARLDCAIAERNHVNTLARLLDAQERITELTAERDALLKSFAVTSQPIKVIQPKGVVE